MIQRCRRKHSHNIPGIHMHPIQVPEQAPIAVSILPALYHIFATIPPSPAKACTRRPSWMWRVFAPFCMGPAGHHAGFSSMKRVVSCAIVFASLGEYWQGRQKEGREDRCMDREDNVAGGGKEQRYTIALWTRKKGLRANTVFRR